MGVIVYWTIIRTAIVIVAVWLLKSQIDEQLWYIITIAISYGVIIHPAITGFRNFEEKNKSITESTLCSNCKHFDKSAVLCIKHDKHPTEDYIPCDGIHWEIK